LKYERSAGGALAAGMTDMNEPGVTGQESGSWRRGFSFREIRGGEQR